MSDVVGQIPKDASGVAFDRAMGIPIVKDSIILGSATKWVDIFDISAYSNRAFIGMMIYNPSATLDLKLALTDAFGTDHCITAKPQQLMVFDDLSFGPGFSDIALAKAVSKIRGILSSASGTLASMTITYAASPANGKCVKLNGIVYEFSSDQSVAPGRIKVNIGVSADDTWTNLVTAVNATDQSLTLTIDTGTNVVTVTSNYGGNSLIPTVDGDEGGANTTGETFSGATTSGGSGGVTPTIHIW